MPDRPANRSGVSPDLPLERLPDLLVAEQLLDDVIDSPHKQTGTAIGRALAAAIAGKNADEADDFFQVPPSGDDPTG